MEISAPCAFDPTGEYVPNEKADKLLSLLYKSSLCTFSNLNLTIAVSGREVVVELPRYTTLTKTSSFVVSSLKEIA